MTGANEFSLRINGFTPETLPMERLAAYVAQFARLLGSEPKVHFVRVGEGSAELISEAEGPELQKITRRLQLVKLGAGTNEARTAFQKIDDLLFEDNTDASVRHGQSNVLEFPGKARVIAITYDSVIQEDSIDGVLISIGGRDESVPLHLADGKTVFKCNTTKAKARAIAPHIFGSVLRVYGTADWRRDADSVWRLNTMNVEEFVVLNDDDAEAVIGRLRKVPGNDWHKVPNPYELLAELRGEVD